MESQVVPLQSHNKHFHKTVHTIIETTLLYEPLPTHNNPKRKHVLVLISLEIYIPFLTSPHIAMYSSITFNRKSKTSQYL